MKVIYKNIGKQLQEYFSKVIELKIAVAYFSPDKTTITLLKKIPNVEIIISDEFSLLNPQTIEILASSCSIKYLPSDRSFGKLHCKIYYGRFNNFKEFLFIGSANLTHKGFFCNSESGVLIESSDTESANYFKQFTDWFEELKLKSDDIDIDLIKNSFNYFSRIESKTESNYWVLKTTDGASGYDYWPHFVIENVIAIGWKGLKSDPITDSKNDVINELIKKHTKKSAEKAYSKIKAFVGMKENDYVIISKGYPANSNSDVRLYGIAKVVKSLGKDLKSDWWQFKHIAIIQKVEMPIPKNYYTNYLNMKSMLEAIHSIDEKAFNKFVNAIEKNYGIHLNL